MKITSVTIAKNEQRNIGRCIESLLGLADEIIVLIDDSTSDQTEAVVRSFPGVRGETVKWQGYAKTKEYGLSLASFDWILWIDADEAVSAELKAEIINLKTGIRDDISAFSVPRKAWFLGRWITHSGWYPGRINRLFRKSRSRFTSTAVHESLEIDGPVARLNNDLLHYTDPDIHHYYEKFNTYTSLAAGDLLNKNKKFSILDLIIRPPFLFFKMYIMKAGFLDGLQGFMLAVFSANYVFTKYAKLWEKQNNS